MKCPQCQHENPDGSRFCNGCGAKLDITCSACAHVNPPGSRFCNACGHNLVALSSTQPGTQAGTEAELSPTEPSIPEAERRQLTVMFCDLVGSTHLSGQLDPEDLREVVRAYQSACTDVIQRYDGHVAQLLGDGLLVYFGYPAAHEEDAQRSVLTGLGILDAIETLNTHLEPAKGIKLAVRLGIHTGLVVVGEMGGEGRQEQLALGEVPNVSSRIQGLAESNTIVISSSTYGLVQGYFDCQTLGEQALKGVAQPITVYRVLQESGAQSRLDIASRRGLTPLIGRESESTLLFERWEQVKDGHGQVVLLSGEAGIGKSRLVQVLKDHVTSEPHAQEECRCSPYHTNSAFFPLAELLQRKLGWQPKDTADEKLHKLETILAQTHLDVEVAVPLFTALLSLPLPDDRYPPIQVSSQQQRQQTLEAFLQLVLLAAQQHPVLFMVEDLHWVDPSTLEFLELLIAQAPTTAIFMLLTCRPEFQPTWSHRSYLTEVSLSRLSRPQIEQIATQVASGKALPADVIEQLVDKTDGVPLYVEEMTKSVLESGYLKAVDGHYELTGAMGSLTIPATLQDSLMARLDRLVTAKGVAQYASVIGRQFSYELLQAVSELDEGTLQRELSRLVEVELVYQRGVIPQATYMFKHVLVQDTAYQSLLRHTRQAYHRRIAEVLEERFPETADVQPEFLAHHFTGAGLNEQAVDYWYRAGQRASQRSAYVEAIAHLTKGLELVRTLPETPGHTQSELLLLTTLGPALMVARGQAAQEAEHIYAQALELCRQVGDTTQLVPTLLGLRGFYVMRGDLQTTRELDEQLLRLAQQAQDPALLVEAHWATGITLFLLGEMIPGRAHLEQSISIYDAQPPRSQALLDVVRDPGVAARGQISMLLWVVGYPDQARTRSHQALTLAQELADPYSQAIALASVAGCYLLCREVRAVYERAEAAVTVTQAQGIPMWLAFSTFCRGWAQAAQGQSAAGMTQMHQSLANLQVLGVTLLQPWWLTLLAETYGRVGQMEEGLRVLREASSVVDKTGERWHEAETHRLRGEFLLQQSPEHHCEAEACFHQALTIAQHQSAKSWELRAATSLARLWQSQDKRQEAYDLLSPVYGWFTEGFDTADLVDAKVLLDKLRK